MPSRNSGVQQTLSPLALQMSKTPLKAASLAGISDCYFTCNLRGALVAQSELLDVSLVELRCIINLILFLNSLHCTATGMLVQGFDSVKCTSWSFPFLARAALTCL